MSAVTGVLEGLCVRESFPAQQLLNLDVTHSGFLKYKRSIMGFRRWSRCYAILYKGALYLYDGANSKKPHFSCSLIAYDRIDRSATSSTRTSWTFSLHPLIDIMPIVSLCAASKQEMVRWMAELRVSMLAVHGRPSDAAQQQVNMIRWNSAASLSTSELEDSVYSCGEERIAAQHRLHSLTPDALVADMPEYLEITGSQDSLDALGSSCSNRVTSEQEDQEEDRPVSTTVYDDLEESYETNQDVVEDKEKEKEDESERYYRSAMFYGTREEARNLLRLRHTQGVFLVRIHEGRQVLTVKGWDTIFMYVLTVDKETAWIGIENTGKNFESLPHLLHHYHNEKLPNRDILLKVPYLLDEC